MSAVAERLWMSLSSADGWRRVDELVTDAGCARETALRYLREWGAANEVEVGRPPEHGLELMARRLVDAPDPPRVDRDAVTTYISRAGEPFRVHVNRQTGEVSRRRVGVLGSESYEPMPPAGSGVSALRWEPPGGRRVGEAHGDPSAPPPETDEEAHAIFGPPEVPDEARIAAAAETAGALIEAREAAPALEPVAVDPERGGMLARIDQASRLLVGAQSDLERLRIRDKGRAVEAAARILGRTEVQVEASLLVQHAERAIAQAHPAPTPAEATARRGQGVARGDTIAASTLRDIRAAHAPLDDEDYLALVAEARETGTPLTRRAVRAAGRPKVVHNSGEIEWYTPPEVMDRARHVFGGEVDLDPCSCEVAQRVVRARRWWGVEEDGLAQDWTADTLWLNPPYSQAARWIDHAVYAVASGRVRHALVLALNSTETEWCQRLLEDCDAVAFPRGRIRFLAADGERRKAGIQGQIVAQLLAPDMPREEAMERGRRFVEAWEQAGIVMSPLAYGGWRAVAGEEEGDVE